MGIPTNMLTVMFVIGRLPGWIAHWMETVQDKDGKIYRPRQIYTGPRQRTFIPIDQRKPGAKGSVLPPALWTGAVDGE